MDLFGVSKIKYCSVQVLLLKTSPLQNSIVSFILTMVQGLLRVIVTGHFLSHRNNLSSGELDEMGI